MSNNMTSSIALDPKMAAEHLGGFVVNSQAYNMDALGFQHLQPMQLKPGVVKKKSRNKDGENVSYQQQQESYVGTPYAESYREEYQDDDEEQEHEEDEVEQVEEQSKGSHSIASLESKYARMYNQEFTNNIAADPPAQPMERTAPTAVVANVSAPYPRYTPKVRTSNYQDQYLPSTTQTNQPNISAPNVTPAMLSGTAPYPKWSPPASLKNYQENSAPLYSNTQQDNSAIPPSIPPARPSSHSVSPSMGNGYAKYQANQFPLASQEEVPKRATPDEAEPENTPSTLPIDPRNVPGQATYKWQPPALLKQFQDANSNDSFDPQTNISPSYSQPPTSQPQYVLPQPVTPQTHAPATMKPVSSEFILWSKNKPFHVIMKRVETESLECDPNIATESGVTLFHVACEVGNVQLCFYLLGRYGPNSTLAQYNFAGFQPLHVAAQFGQIQIFIELSLIPGCASYFQGLTQRTQDNLFHICVKYNQHSLLSYLYTSNLIPRSELKKFNGQGQSPLHLACHYGYDASLQLLLSLPEPDLLEPNQQKMTSLDIICSQGHLNMLRHLHTVYLPTQPSAVLSVLQSINQMGFTCLHTACQYQQYHIIDYLVNAAKVNPDGVNGQSKKPSEVVGNDFTSYLLYGRMKAVNTPPTMSFQSKSPSPSSTMDQPSTTSSKYANGVIETESQSLSQSPWANVALRKSTQSNQDSKFKSKPYVPPSNVSFLPPKTNTTSNEDKLAIARERMKTKKNDSWMKPKAEDDTPSDQPNLPQQSPPSPQVQPRSASIKYSSIEMDSSSDESDNENENDNTSVEPLVSEPPAEPEPISLFSKISAWFENEDNLSLLEEYFGVGNELKEDINAIVEPTTNETLLHRACTTGMINIVQCLIEGAGSNVNAVDSQGSSPLHYAIRSCQPLIAKYLIKKCGSDLRLKDCNQLTPLELCNQLLAQTDGDNHAALLDIQQVLEKYENKSIDKRLKIIQPVYQARESNSSN